MTTSRELLTHLAGEVRSVWQRGWQPAELVRQVRRAMPGGYSAVLIDAMAVLMREYAPATVDDRWKAQIADVGATVSWSDDGDLTRRWANHVGLFEPQVLRVVEALTFQLRRLPTLPFAGPPPGEYRPGTDPGPADAERTAQAGHAGGGSGDGRLKGQQRPGDPRERWGDGNGDARPDERMLAKVRALLAKAESTSFPEEAEAYTAKAQELMARHSIDEALLSARTGVRTGPGLRRIAVDNPYEAPKTLLLQAVAGANRCRCVWSKEFGLATVMGFPTDLDAVEILFTSLLVQAVRAMTQHPVTTASFRRAFLTAYAVRIGQRLDDAAERAQEGAGSDLLPILSRRADEVQQKFAEVFPAVRTQRITATNSQGWAEGRAAADRADLHGRAAVRAKSPAGRE